MIHVLKFSKFLVLISWSFPCLINQYKNLKLIDCVIRKSLVSDLIYLVYFSMDSSFRRL